MVLWQDTGDQEPTCTVSSRWVVTLTNNDHVHIVGVFLDFNRHTEIDMMFCFLNARASGSFDANGHVFANQACATATA